MRFSQVMLMMAFVAMLGVATASAEVVAEYTFDDGSPSATNVLSPIVASDVSTTNASISSSTDRIFAWGDDVFDGSSGSVPGPDSGTASAEFTLTPSEDGMVLDNIQGTVGANPHGDVPEEEWTANWAYYASTDGFATDETYLGTASGPVDEANQSFQFDLSGLGEIHDDLTIRMVAYYTSDTHTAPDYPKFGQVHSVYDMTVNGGVVPEPATMGLLGFGAIALIARRKRR